MRSSILYIILISTIMTSCQNKSAENVQQSTEEHCILTPELKGIIKTDSVQLKNVNQEIELTGSVSYNQDDFYSYQSLVSGVVQKVNFKIGDFVEKGQLLAEVRTSEFNDYKSDLLKAKAELRLALRKLDAAKNLHADGVASDKELLEAQNEVSNAQLEINRIQETVKLQGGNIERGILAIKAATSGYVVQKKMTTGTQIDAGQDDLFILSNLKKVWIMANIYTTQLESVKAGQPVEIQTAAYPNKIFHGKISRISNIFDEEERVLKAIIEIDNSQLLLKPAMMVAVHIYNPIQQKSLAIPQKAVLFDQNTYQVIVNRNNCNPQLITVEPIGKDKNFYYVNSDALKVHDKVITQNQLLIYNQLKDR